MIQHHARVLKLSPAFADRPLIVCAESNKGHESQYYHEFFHQAIEPGATLSDAGSRVFPICQMNRNRVNPQLKHGWWTKEEDKREYVWAIQKHMGGICDLSFEKNQFSVCPFQLTQVDMTPQKLAVQNRAKLISQCRRFQHIEIETTSAIGAPRTGYSGTANPQLKKNVNTQDDLVIALGLALRVLDLVRHSQLPPGTFPYGRFRACCEGYGRT